MKFPFVYYLYVLFIFVGVRGPYEDVRDSVLAFTVITILFVVFSLCNIIPILEVQYITFTLHVITRSFLYATVSAGIPVM